MSFSELRSDEEIARLYEKYVNTVYRVAFMMLKEKAETEDVVQNVFIKLMNSDNEFTDDEHILRWLIVAAKNECKNLFKHWWKSKRNHLEDAPEPTYSDNKDTDSIMEQVKALPEKYSLPVYLYYYEGYKTYEIAKILDVNEATLRSRLAVAREKLKLMIGVNDDE
ncbi:MAG: sigma-70 family RNA polymerase sigma factor [Clostridia bacterium]|nr:sigma-70 family RNA polymerase sigma factor [Clostridia bacterium]